MSDDITTNDPSEEGLKSNLPVEASNEVTKDVVQKARSPVERLLVWGGICVLLAIVAVEARARFGYQKTLNGFENAGGASGPDFVMTLPEFSKLVAFNPSVTTGSSSIEIVDGQSVTRQYDDENQGRDKTVQYKWRSLFKEYSILLTVSRDGSQVILSIQTNTPVSQHGEMMFVSRPEDSGVVSSGDEGMEDDDQFAPAVDEGDADH